MIKINFIGYGVWGKKIYPIIKKIHDTKVKLFKKNNISDKNSIWDFIFTNNKTHYSLVKKSIMNGKNVYCEKPLVENVAKAKELYKLSKKFNKKLYVCDVENFKKIQISLKKNNTVVRKKYSKDKRNILWRLAYHDFTYIYKLTKGKKISKIKIIKSGPGFINFKVRICNKNFNFYYSLNSKNKIHSFNNTSLLSKKNYYLIMIKNLINNKNIDFDLNKKISIYCIKVISTIALLK